MKRRKPRHQHRGTVAPLTVLTMPVLLGFAALAVDIAQLCNTKAELQRAADAAALAGASAYLTDAGLKDDHSAIKTLAGTRAQYTSKANTTLNSATLLDAKDIALGTHDVG